MLTIDEELDVRGFNDPIPTMRAMKRLGQLAVNQRLKVITNYGGGAILDFEALCKSRNHELMETREENGDIIFIICL